MSTDPEQTGSVSPETAAGEPSVFTRIIDREIPAAIVYESDTVIAFQDIAPKAPVHILVVPKDPRYANVVELAAGDPDLLADMIDVASRIAADGELMTDRKTGQKYASEQFRLIFNTGPAVGQTVFHVHAHVMAGNLKEGSLA